MQHRIILRHKEKQFTDKEVADFVKKVENKLPHQYWVSGTVVNLNEVLFALSEIRFDLDRQIRFAVFNQINDRKLAVS